MILKLIRVILFKLIFFLISKKKDTKRFPLKDIHFLPYVPLPEVC